MSYRQVLGIAFKTWDKEHCISMIAAGKINKQYRLAANAAKYVLAKKFRVRVE